MKGAAAARPSKGASEKGAAAGLPKGANEKGAAAARPPEGASGEGAAARLSKRASGAGRTVKHMLARNKFIIAAFFMPVLLVVLAFAVTKIYPFGEMQIAVIDMYHQYVPFLSELQYKLQEGGSLFYTWNGAGGSNFWNLLAYYGASPLNLLLALFPKEFIMEGVTVILLIKIGLAGSFMAMYLRYVGNRCDMVTAAFATLYALCAYVMGYYWCIMWIDAVALLPLCILGLNRIIDDGRAVLYTVALALTVFCNYYIAIMVCIFILCYYPVLYFTKVRNGTAKGCAIITGKAVGYSFLAIAMSAVMLLPTYISMQNTYYISADMPESWSFYNDALDVLNQLLPNAELTFREGLPNLYCGMLVVILMVLYVASERIGLREKLINGAFLIFMFFSLNVNKLDFIWHGFHFPNQLPYRYSFVISFLLIGMAYRILLQADTFKVKTLWTVLAAGTAYYLIAQKLLKNSVDDMTLFFYGGLAWLALYCGVLLLYRKGHLNRKTFALLIVVVIAAEMGAGTCTSFHKVGNSLRTSYFENYQDVLYFAEKTGEEFVRTEMDYCHTLNDPAMYHYRGLSQFSSAVNANVTALMEKIGLEGEPGKNRFNYNLTNPVTDAMLGVKYIIAKNLKLGDEDFTFVEKSGHTRLYESKYPLAMGYMVGDAIRTWDTESENPFEVLDDYVRAATGNAYDKVFYSLGEPAEIKGANCTIQQAADEKLDVLFTDENSPGTVELEYKSEKTQKYYIFIEASNADSITVNKGSVVDDISIMNDCGSIVNIGEVEAGKTFKVTIDYLKGQGSSDVTCRISWMDRETWNDAYRLLAANTMEVVESGDTFVKGKVDVKEDGVLVTSIPYEKGWSMKIDGRKRDISELTGGVWISASLDEGEHEIELRFRPPGLVAGLVVTVVAAALLALFQLIRAGRRRRLLELLQELEDEESQESELTSPEAQT